MTAARRIQPLVAPPDTTVRVPGSKSITNRVLPAAALATGRSVIRGAGFGDDTEAMLESLRELGVHFVVDRDAGSVKVTGTAGALPSTPTSIYVHQSGTTARFLTAITAPSGEPVRIDGDPQLRARPMGDLVAALRSLGITVTSESAADGTLPFTVFGTPRTGPQIATLHGSASSQFLSGLLLSGPRYPGGLTVEVTGGLVSRPYVDMTRSVMGAFGVDVTEPEPGRFVVIGGQQYRGVDFHVEPDASSASYFFAAAAITGGRVRVEGLGSGSLQGDLEFAEVLGRMGADVSIGVDVTEVRGTGSLVGVDADLSDFSDCAPTLGVVAAFATSPTRVSGIGFIRRKESDHVGNVVRELRRCGIEADEEEDGFVVHPGRPAAARIETYDDHRMAMAFALVGLVVDGIEIAGPACVAKTYPEYWDALEQLR